MSIKINARSPFYLNLTEPVQPAELFTCGIAGATGFVVSSSGVITLPTLSNGTIVGQSDDSFTAIGPSGTPTLRTLTLTIQIPARYSNYLVGTIPCDVTFTQPKQAPVDTPGENDNCPTTLGTITPQTLANSTGTATIAVNGKFARGTATPISGYRVINNHPSFINASISGNNLVLSALSTCGTKSIFVEAYQAADSCTAVQEVSITINNCTTYSCTTAGLSGGSISQDGLTIVEPTGLGEVGDAYEALTGGSAITSVAANTGTADQNVTLYFDVTIPNGFGNSGVLGNRCPVSIVQNGTGLKAAACPGESVTNPETLVFSGWRVLANGTTFKGNVSLLGANLTINSFTTNFAANTGSSTIPKNVLITFTVPSNYSNAGSKSCTLSLNQEAPENPCGSFTAHLTQGVSSIGAFCDEFFGPETIATSTINIQNGIGSSLNSTIICRAGSKFLGHNLFYGITAAPQNPIAGPGMTFKVVRINGGTVTEVHTKTCQTTGDGNQGDIQL
jgi:hypothetical protein